MLTTVELERRRKALFRASIQDQITENEKYRRSRAPVKKRSMGVSTSSMIRDEITRRASVNSCIVKATGEPKKRQTKEEVMEASRAMSKRHGAIFYHYECVHCGHWHVGKRKNA